VQELRRRPRAAPVTDWRAPTAAVGTVFEVVNEALIERAGELLSQVLRPPARVILFGSHARGEARPDSDLDLLVIERDVPSRRAEFVRLRGALRGLGMPVDLIVVSEAHVQEWGALDGTMLKTALEEGRVLVEA